jgi:hypothetical protein
MSILVLTSDTLIGTPATGNIEYNGQFFGTDSNASRAQLQRIVRATAVASTSGTSIDFTGIPAWVERITVMFQGVSTNGTADIIFQLGTGSTPTYTTSGYLGTVSKQDSTSQIFSSSFILVNGVTATQVWHGNIVICNLTSNVWSEFGILGQSVTTGQTRMSGGSVSLGAILTAIRITTSNGTDAFDAGTINILYEG